MNISITALASKFVRKEPTPKPNRSSRKALTKYGPMLANYYLIIQSSVRMRCGFLKAASTWRMNFVKTPGAGDQPNGKPNAIKNSPSILN
jgi:hypothetical protein